MYYGKTCLSECMSSGWYIFQDDVSYWNVCFTGQVLLKGTSYRRSCLTGVHVFPEHETHSLDIGDALEKFY